MLFTVSVTETNYGFIEVNADTADEALKKATEEYHSGNALWNDTDYELNVDSEVSTSD